jgi:DNA-binding transcriptional MerR regulator
MAADLFVIVSASVLSSSSLTRQRHPHSAYINIILFMLQNSAIIKLRFSFKRIINQEVIKMLKISQVAGMLNITSDSLKFYEDKKLLFPKRNEENGYREYSLMDILDILTINFYRNLNFEIKKIQEIRKNKSIDDLYELLKQQEQKTEEEIKLKQKVLDNIRNTVSDYKRVKENLGGFTIREFKPVVVENDASNIIQFDKPRTSADADSFISWNNLIRFSRFNETQIYDTKILIVRDAVEDAETSEDEEIIHLPKCIYTVIEASGKDNLDAEIAEKIKEAAANMNVVLLGTCIVRNLIVTYEDRIDRIYSEIYVTVK